MINRNAKVTSTIVTEFDLFDRIHENSITYCKHRSTNISGYGGCSEEYFCRITIIYTMIYIFSGCT